MRGWPPDRLAVPGELKLYWRRIQGSSIKYANVKEELALGSTAVESKKEPEVQLPRSTRTRKMPHKFKDCIVIMQSRENQFMLSLVHLTFVLNVGENITTWKEHLVFLDRGRSWL